MAASAISGSSNKQHEAAAWRQKIGSWHGSVRQAASMARKAYV